jgi:hypothetical protein
VKLNAELRKFNTEFLLCVIDTERQMMEKLNVNKYKCLLNS